MRIIDLILKKRAGRALSGEELRFLVRGCTDGSVPDYQLSALLMAIWFRGMDPAETAELTMAMADSGERADLSGVQGVKIDKHSTGGVGDKTTLIAAPVAAACGVRVAKMSGRGLGHTGGTADKLEAIPGFRTTLSKEEFFRTVNAVGMSLITQTGSIAPADKKLYALRDVTGTVDSLPLIASSVMSKKLASGCDGVVLDVKTGSGAFMKTPEEARQLAEAMVSIGWRAGMRTSALITDMDRPLGHAVGNAIEVEEAMETLRGGGPADLRELSLSLAAEMIRLAGLGDGASGRKMAEDALDSGRAFALFQRMAEAQGGDPSVLERPLPRAVCRMEVLAERSGFLTAMNTEEIGEAAVILGAGRSRKDDPIDLGAGMRLFRRTGDAVLAGEPLAELHASSESRLEDAAVRFRAALSIGEEPPAPRPLIFSRVSEELTERQE